MYSSSKTTYTILLFLQKHFAFNELYILQLRNANNLILR